MISCYPGRKGNGRLSYGAWMELVSDSNLLGGDFPRRNVGLAFALAQELKADVCSDWRGMEVSWSEFLVAIAALVVLKPGYTRAFFADHLEGMLVDNIEEARKKVLYKKPGAARNLRSYDPNMVPLVDFLGKMFEEADEDGSGAVDRREFRRVFGQSEFESEMGQLGISLSELDVLFLTLDRDGDGDLTWDEICDGFVTMKKSMKGIDRAISYIRKTFKDADEDESGTLDKQEFHALFDQPATLKKLEALGVSKDDIEDLFEVVGKEQEDPEITVDDIIQGFVRLRDPRNGGLRGLRILKHRFNAADADGSGDLSKEEVLKAFDSEEVINKLKIAELKTPDWSTLFEELDVDGSGGLTWEEIADGMKAFWASL